MIEPTVGRIVWYRPNDPLKMADPDYSLGRIYNAHPLAAIVVGVHTSRCVNLVVFGAKGNDACMRESVILLQDGDERPTTAAFCEWMPYQKGQAAKTEAAEAKVAAS